MPFYPPGIRDEVSYINFAGHSYLNTTLGIFDQPYRMDFLVRGMLGVPPAATTNRALSGAQLLMENPGNAGWSTILQQVRRPARGAPYIARGGIYVNCWGINDIGKQILSADFGVGIQYTQIRAAFREALRAVISRQRASSVAEAGSTDQSAQWSFQAGWLDQALLTVNSGAGYRRYPGNTVFANNVATYTIPADIPTTTIAFGFVGGAGKFGGTLQIGGTAGFTGTIDTGNVMPGSSGTHGHLCRRFAVTAANAGQTITFSVIATDTTSGSSEIDIDYAQIEATTPPLVVVCNIPRLRDTAAYVSYAGSYWANGSNNGASGDFDVANFNADIAAVCAEFTDGMVVVSDIDAAFAKNPINYSTDGIHPNEVGSLKAAQAIVATIRAAPTQAANTFQDYRAAAGRRRPRLANAWYGPEIVQFTASVTPALANGQMWAFPFEVTEVTERIDGCAITVDTLASGTITGTALAMRVGIYDDEEQLCYPKCVIDDFGTFATTAVATVTTLTPNRPLEPGLYWIAIKCEGHGATTPGTLKAFTGSCRHMPYNLTAAAPSSMVLPMPGAYSFTGQPNGSFMTVLPSFPSQASATLITNQIPLVVVRRSAFSL